MSHRGFRSSGRGWALILGILLIVLGIISLSLPLVLTTLVITNLLIWILIVGGVLDIVYAFRAASASQFFLKLIPGILFVLAGVVLLGRPIPAVLTLTLVVGIIIFVSGVFQIVRAFRNRPDTNWFLSLISGIFSVILGILIWSQWPFDAAWIIGLFVGLSLLFDGIAIALMAAFPPSQPPSAV